MDPIRRDPAAGSGRKAAAPPPATSGRKRAGPAAPAVAPLPAASPRPEALPPQPAPAPCSSLPPPSRLSPHVHRLLRLLHDGGGGGRRQNRRRGEEEAGAASAASSRLVALVRGNALGDEGQRWELAGRVQSLLKSGRWRSRTEAAAVLRAVAARLPLYAADGWTEEEEEDDGVGAAAGNASSPAGRFGDSRDGGLPAETSSEKVAKASASRSCPPWSVLTLDLLDDWRRLSDDESCHLLARSFAGGWAEDSDEEEDGRDSVRLDDPDRLPLEATARWEQQTRVLHRRLGLPSAIGAPSGLPTAAELVDDAPGNVASAAAASSGAPPTKSRRSRPQSSGPTKGKGSKPAPKKRKRRRRRRRGHVDDEDYEDDSDDLASANCHPDGEVGSADNTLHALLRSCASQRSAVGRRHPHAILATDLLCRTVDPAWHVRHGAFLGILALLQGGWASMPASAPSSSSSSPDAGYGSWLRSVLVASLYVLAMDRFGDFSGAVLRELRPGGGGGGTSEQEVSDSEDEGSAVLASAVVAPVREVAGQVAAAAWRMAPAEVLARAADLLLEMSRDPGAWEVRHGALTALKYVAALSARSDGDGELLSRAAQSAAEALLDDSDDVQSAAAELLRRCLGRRHRCSGDGAPLREDPSPPVPPSSVVPNLWSALLRARPYSSCLVDLIRLLRLFVRRDCRGFLRQIGDGQGGPAADGGVAKALAGLLDCDFPSVRLAALQCAGRLALPLAEQCRAAGDPAPYGVLMGRIFDEVLRSFGATGEDRPLDRVNDEHVRDSDSTVMHVAQSKAWSDLSAGATAIFRHDEALRISFLDSFLRRYFLIGSAYSFQACNEAADALPSFIRATQTTREDAAMPVLEFYLLSFVRSPWSSLCEASCLLVSSLFRSRKEQTTLPSGQEQKLESPTIIERLEDLLWDMISGAVRPPCLMLGADNRSNGSLLSDPQVIRSCHDAFARTFKELSDSGTHQRCPDLSDNLVELWSRTIEGLFGSTPFPTQAEASIDTMRVHASLAGATLALAIPSKITPIVRAFMTSLNNEPSPSRLQWTSNCVSSLLLVIEHQTQFSTARERVLESLCAMAESENSSEMPSASPGSQALTRYISTIVSRKTLRDIGPVWSRVAKILEYEACVDQESLDSSVSLLKGISKGFQHCADASFADVEAVIERLTCLASETHRDELRVLAEETLRALCSADPTRILKVVLRTIYPYLRESKLAKFRSKASSLLETIVSVSGESLCPFVKALLPVIMLLMTDTCQECSRCANKAFASLVRLAPLVREGHSVALASVDSSGCESVIDHLIMGRPLPPITLPDEIRSSLCRAGVVLRPYQQEGVAWLRFLQTMHLNGALCDSMGLGKTLQALIAIALSHDDNPDDEVLTVSLIVCPSTVVGHWMTEIAKFFPESSVLRPICYAGTKAQRESLWKRVGSSANVVVTSYAVLRTDVDILTEPIFRTCTLDEGHLLKNPKTATARAARRVVAKHRLILTGTPVQNRVHELWAAFDFLMPNFLGSASSFAKEFGLPITKGQCDGAKASTVVQSLERLTTLHQQVLPFILRREKDEVLKDLPPKIVSYVKVTMTDAQDQLYRRLCSNSTVRSSLTKLEDVLKPTEDGMKASTVDKEVLKSLMLLRLTCTHPRLITAGGRHIDDDCGLNMSGKLLALVDLLRNAGLDDSGITAADNDTSLIYCDDQREDATDDYDKVIETTQDIGLGQDESTVACGATSKYIIFAQFTKSLDLVEDLILRPLMPSIRYLRLDGRVPPERRAELARRFNSDPSIRVFLSTTRVGGLGLNLTGADTVFFLENDYNPFVDVQAQDRAHRIGQLNCVNVYNLVTNNSIEEKIVELQRKKIAISGAIVNTENSSMYSMGTDRILDIFTSRSSANANNAEGETLDIDALIEQHGNDYASLSVDEFLKGLERNSVL